ncbi:RYamide receptor-like [Tubulanus polymorphus]|uniref:RYamide receptor-like n=1 Tax=Tubulanus polymorphus TaxID=672921 RepID=UPI003DA55195
MQPAMSDISTTADGVVENFTNSSQFSGLKEVIEFDVVRNVFYPCRDIALFFLVFSGNALVLLSILKTRNLQTCTNYMLASLSCADMLVSICSLLNFFKWIHRFNWLQLSVNYCIVAMFLYVVSLTSSMYHLIAISFDRFLSTRWPIKYRTCRTTSHTVVIVCVIWFLSVATAMPTIFVTNTTNCSFETFFRKAHVLMLGCIMLSADFIIVFVYGLIGCSKRRQRRRVAGMVAAVDETFQQRQENKSTKLLLKISLVFIVCWTPLGVSCIMLKYTTETFESWFYPIRAVFLFLAASNSFMNPIIYCWNSQTFRAAFKRLLCGRCTCSPRSTNIVTLTNGTSF